MLRILIISHLLAIILAMNTSNSPSSSNQPPKRQSSSLNPKASDFIPAARRYSLLPQNQSDFSEQFPHPDIVRSQLPYHQQMPYHLLPSNLQNQRIPHGFPHQNYPKFQYPSILQSIPTSSGSQIPVHQHSAQTVEPEELPILPVDPFDFTPEEWEEETSEQQTESTSSNLLSHQCREGQQLSDHSAVPTEHLQRRFGAYEETVVKNRKEKMKEEEKSSSFPDIVHKNGSTSAGEFVEKKGNEANLTADQLKAISLEEEAGRPSLEDKKQSEDGQQMPEEGIPKVDHGIKTTPEKEEKKSDEIVFGSFPSPLRSDLTGIDQRQTPDEAGIEQKMDKQFVEQKKQEGGLPNVSQKKLEAPHLQQQSSSSSAKDGRKSMRSVEPGMKPVSSIPTTRGVQDQRQQAAHWKEPGQKQSVPTLERKSISSKQLVPKKNSPSSSPTASSSMALSPLSAASLMPTSPPTENKFDLLVKQERKEDDQQEGRVAQKDNTESGSGIKKGAAIGSSKGGNPKIKSKKQIDHEDRLELAKAVKERKRQEQSSKHVQKQEDHAVIHKQSNNPVKMPSIGSDKQKGVATSSGSHIEEKSQNTASLEEEGQQELKVPVIDLVLQINHLQDVHEVCKLITDPSGKEHELRELKNSYMEVMRRLDNFLRKFGDKYGNYGPSSNYFYDILLWIGQIYPAIDRKELNKFRQIMVNCLVYLDDNGGLTSLNESDTQLNILDELFQNISKLDGLIGKYNKAKNKAKGGAEKANALKNLEDWYEQGVDNELLYEAIGYLHVGVKKRKTSAAGEGRKSQIGQISLYLKKFEFVLPRRKKQISYAVKTICKLFSLPMFQMSDNSPSSETTTSLSKPGQNIQPCAAEGSGSSASQTHPPNMAMHNTSDSHSDIISFEVIKTPEEREKTMASALKNLISQIVMKVNLLQSINYKCTDIDARPQSEMERLGHAYNEVMDSLETFTYNYGNKYQWDGNTHFSDIFKWICTTFKPTERLELPDFKSLVNIMSTSMVLLYMQNPTKIDELLTNVNGLNANLNKYNNAGEERSLKFKLMETHYKLLVDPNLRELFHFQFIGILKTKMLANKRIERMRKSVLQKGWDFLTSAMREHGTPGQWERKFDTAKQTLVRYFDTWTAGLEAQIRADLPGYVGKFMGFKWKTEEQKDGEAAKTSREKAEEKNAMDVLKLETMADTGIEYLVNFERREKHASNGTDLEESLKAIDELVKGWEPIKQSIVGSSSSMSKRARKKAAKGKAIIEKDDAEEEKGGEAEKEALINLFSWKSVLADVQKLIRYIFLLNILQALEMKVEKEVDRLDVHVKIWSILFEKISPIIDVWDYYYFVEKGHPKDQMNDSMQETLEFLANDIEKFLTKYGQSKKGKLVSKALEIVIVFDQNYVMRHRNKHLRRFLTGGKIELDEEDH